MLESYVAGRWYAAPDLGVGLADAATGADVARISSTGLDIKGMLDHARKVGGPALRALTFHERASMLRALGAYLMERKEDFYDLSFATGATRKDGWIDIEGGVGTMLVYASKGRRELPNDTILADGAVERISRNGTFLGQHVYVSRQGVAVQINAFNFPCWGMLEKLGPAILAGMPVVVKPASPTAWLCVHMVKEIVKSGILPEGAIQLISGSAHDLLDHLTAQDVVSFTGSAATAAKLAAHPNILENAIPFIAERDSLNASILGPDAGPDTPEFDLFVKEVAREMTVKAGQKCTAIRRALVPAAHLAAVEAALVARLQKVTVGDPRRDDVQMGPLASLDQRREVHARVEELKAECAVVLDGTQPFEPLGADYASGAFLRPTLLRCDDPVKADAVHRVEAFGPVSTLMPYGSLDEAIALANRGEGALVASLFSADPETARTVVAGIGAWHGRVCVIDRHSAKESTGHGSPLAHLKHGGPGRAGGSEELAGIAAVKHYLQKVAVQGSPDVLTAVARRWVPGATVIEDKVHPFRKDFATIRLGDTLKTKARTITKEDVEHFAHFTGDTFYAHMDDEAAAANPFFGQRVAHGYLLLSFAAGLFVDPAPGPVLANYGLNALSFMKPVGFGDTIRVELTCKEKVARIGAEYGEVRWDVRIFNQDEDLCATYELLTLNALTSDEAV